MTTDERERIARAIENDSDRQELDGWEMRSYDRAARIARNARNGAVMSEGSNAGSPFVVYIPKGSLNLPTPKHDPICELAAGTCVCAAVRDVQRHARTMERERIAAAIEKRGGEYFEQDYALVMRDAARIARGGFR